MPERGEMTVTAEEAATLAECIAWAFMDDGDETRALLPAVPRLHLRA